MNVYLSKGDSTEILKLNMKKLFTVGLSTFLLLGGCCGSEPDPYLDIQGIDIFNRNKLSATSSNDSVKLQDFYIEISYKGKFYAQATKSGFSFIPAAMATQPCKEAGYKGTKERIESISITALSDYNGNFPKGSVLNPIMNINGTSEADFFNQQSQSGLGSYGLILTFTEKPDSTVQQAFEVRIRLTNGEEYSGHTEPITIL